MTKVSLLSVAPLCLVLAACAGGAPAPAVSVTSANAGALPAPAKTEDANKATEATEASKAPGTTETKKASHDPLAIDAELEAASIPTIELTPKKELSPRSRADFDAAVTTLANETSLEGAVKKLVARLGKPTWVEGGKRRVWIARDGKSCHRLVLDADGQAEVETAPASEWRMLTALAQQNACTGEIKKGSLGGK